MKSEEIGTIVEKEVKRFYPQFIQAHLFDTANLVIRWISEKHPINGLSKDQLVELADKHLHEISGK